MRRSLKIILVTSALLLISAAVAACAKNTPPDVTAVVKNSSVFDAHALINKNLNNVNFVVMDVRTPEEFASGHIAGAVNVDVQSPDFGNRIQTLDKSKSYLVYCRTGVRSLNASQQMVKLGFSDVTNMLAGITEWQAAGYPVVQ